jgi:signal transduction histidine kinase/ligand-binding sensor domain-containing protein/CheY-like chemotaxis protein
MMNACRSWPGRAFPLLSLLVAILGAAASSSETARADPDERWRAMATPVFHNITRDSGLPSGAEPTVFGQDGQGFIWMGSQNGLLRWDGASFKRYMAHPGAPGALPANFIVGLHTDPKGRLWVATRVGGLVRYDPAQDRFVAYGAPRDWVRTTIKAITDDGRGGMWVGLDTGLRHLDEAGRVIAPVEGAPTGAIEALLRDRAGGLWVASAKGLFHRPPSGGDLAPVPLAVSGRSPVRPMSVFEDSAGRLWVGTAHSGVFIVAPDRPARPLPVTGDAAELFATLQVRSIVQGPSGEVWASASDHGVAVIDPATFHLHWLTHERSATASLADDSVNTLYRDRSGLIWVGTYRGVSLYNPAGGAAATVFGPSEAPGGLRDGDVDAVAVMPDGRVWLGLVKGGVDIIDPLRGRIAALGTGAGRRGGLPPVFVNSIAAARGGAVYVATSAGLFRTDLSGRRVTPVSLPVERSANVRALMWRDGYLWVGHYGLTRLRIGSSGLPVGRPEHVEAGLTDPWVSSLEPGPDGSVWVGGRLGLARVDRRLRVLDRVVSGPEREGLAEGGVTTLQTDPTGRLWVGSTTGGINILTGRGRDGRLRFRHLGVEEGLPNANVDRLLLSKDGFVWASTDDGLARIDPRTLAITPLKAADGVYFATYWANSGAVTPQGELIFGALGGLTVVRPDAYRPRAFTPALAVTRVELGGEAAPAPAVGDSGALRPLVVAPDGNSLAVEFAALDYAAPETVRYSYRLDGYDRQWIETDADHRTAAYTNLPPGSYTLRLRATTPDGRWMSRTLDLPVRVTPAWWQTNLFRLGVVAAAAAALAALVYCRTSAQRRYRRRLEKLVEERTAQLRDQTELALAASQSKSAFLAMMSHELRTPMNGVLGMARALGASPLSSEQAGQVKMIMESGDSLMTILNDILEISKIESGKLELEETVFDLPEVARMVHSLWAEIASAKGVTLACEIDPSAPRWVRGDPTRVRQIMLNLVSNALKFTPTGEVRLALSAGEDGVRIAVSDTGIGISPAQQARLFQSFSQAEASTARRFGGTGLGLSICKQLAELMGGGMSLVSVEGEGSTFTALLPLEAVIAPEAASPQSPAPERAGFEGLRVLVVDDNMINLAVARAILGAVDVVTTTADSAQEALALLREASFDIVLMDLHMPRMTGAEALAQIRAGAAGRPDMPVIALTADVMAGREQAMLDQGFDGVQAKPIDPAALVSAIAAVLDLRADAARIPARSVRSG